ncbi:MAG: hypothetical protein QW097_01605 [archaeon]
MTTVNCPNCKSKINLQNNIEAGDFITCPVCGAELEVIKKKNKLDVVLITLPEETEMDLSDLGEEGEFEDIGGEDY